MNIRVRGPEGLKGCLRFGHAGDTDLNVIVTEWTQKTSSVSQHLVFISRIDKHKYSHIILHKPPNTSYTPCCQRLGGQSPWDWLWEKWHFCQQTVKTVTWQRSISWWFGERGEDWDQILNRSTPIFHQCWHFRGFYIMSECGLKTCHWHCGSVVLGCGKQILDLSHALEALWEVPTQTRIDPAILYKACAPFTHKSPNKSKTVR